MNVLSKKEYHLRIVDHILDKMHQNVTQIRKPNIRPKFGRIVKVAEPKPSRIFGFTELRYISSRLVAMYQDIVERPPTVSAGSSRWCWNAVRKVPVVPSVYRGCPRACGLLTCRAKVVSVVLMHAGAS
jgi:hypothetical protein